MDRNTVIGITLIAAILLGFSFWNSPNKEELARKQWTQDSLAQVEKQKQKQAEAVKAKAVIADTILSDSARQAINSQKFGSLATAVSGKNETITIENELIQAKISTKGGKVSSVLLKNYFTWDRKPLYLFKDDSWGYGFELNTGNSNINTDSLFFEASGSSATVKEGDSASVKLRLNAGAGKYLEYTYTIRGNNYMLGFDVKMVGMANTVVASKGNAEFHWWQKTLNIEKSFENQLNATTIYYKPTEDVADNLSERSDEKLDLGHAVKWVAFKEQFFSSVLVAKNTLGTGSAIETKAFEPNSTHVKALAANISIPYAKKADETIAMQWYFGPNHYKTLKKYDLSMEKIIPLGWGIFGWVNRFLVIPVFDFLNSFNMNFGIIILILTIIIKLVLFPLTYKSYLSTARMRVLKPEIDELNKKYGTDDPLKKQQEMMVLYRQAGVNPLGGCLPMLLQLPILIAMFNFFPSSIELRQEKFLWADDLSTYDSILDLGFNIPFYGDHVSLFTLLMTVSTILYTRMNQQMSMNDPQMAQMKWIMYLMPIIFLGVFNNYSAGLSYYYFLANMITFGQQFLMRKFVNEDEIHRKIQENKSRPASASKSKFQIKLEEMAKQAKERQEQQKKGKK